LSNLEYRVVGDPNFIVIDSITANTISINGLTSCTTYELRMSSICDDTLTSDYSPIIKFTTLGCCTNPDNITATVFDDSTIYVHWDPLFGNKGYEVSYKKVGDLDYTIIPTPGDSVILTSLSNCSIYEIILKSKCSNGLTTSDTLHVKTTGCGACEDKNYCPSYGTEFAEEWISNFSIHTLNNDSGADGYKFFSNLSTLLDIGGSYPISVTPGFDATGFDEYFKVFIDYNQDGDFDDESELVWDAGTTQVKINNTITVPADAKAGNTRLRVVMEYTGLGALPPVACDTIIFGEVEDYCIEIFKAAEPCATPENLDTLSILETSANLTWFHPAPGAITYTLRYGISPVTTWNYIYNIIAPPVSIIGLTDNTNYDWSVQSVCGPDSSGFAQVKTFKTLKTVSTSLVSDAASFRVFPNPFNNNISLSWSNARSKPERIIITDALGTLLKSMVIIPGIESIQLSDMYNFTSGVYLLSIKTGEQIIHKKLVKQ
ncbi:MAG TPA: GEVED domain-containing protein, partial [Saprospiraceae bacterium]|nr:GEVED domain-containing protein [Saprospiraceae bacterium]